MAGYVTLVGFFVFGTALFCPPLQWFLRATVLPKPGQGPSEASMDEGFLRITGVATGSNGGRARAVFYFPTDPGYRDTVSASSSFSFALHLPPHMRMISLLTSFVFPLFPLSLSLSNRAQARMLVESGLVLALEGDRVKVGGGVWTPAVCQGQVLTERLVKSGSSLTVE